MTNLKQPIKDARKAAYLSILAQTGIVGQAAKSSGFDRSTVFRWRQNDPEFAKDFDAAIEDAADTIEAEAMRRAVQGFDEPVWFKGEKVGTTRKHSDYLLGLLLKANKPEKYRERVDQTTTSTNRTQIQIVSEFPTPALPPSFDINDLV